MNSLLPILPLAALFSILWLYQTLVRDCLDWRTAYLRASILWGVYLSLATELLSLFNWLSQPALIVAWGMPIVSAVLVSLSRCSFPVIHRRNIRSQLGPWQNWVLFSLILFSVIITAIVAWLSPPQTWDSLNYHMSRVAHWAQNKSIRHFATGIEFQNVHPPGGEIAILHVYILGQGDQWVNFVQWWAMVSCTIIASWVAKVLGASPRGQIVASLVVATIPLGIVQASSSVNDYVASYWTLAAAAETLNFVRTNPKNLALFFSGSAAGLMMWTKPITAPYLVPLGLILGAYWVSSIVLHPHARLNKFIWTILAVISFVFINAGHWVRNTITYGNPYTSSFLLDTHLNQEITPAGVTSNLIRNMAFHTGLPWGRANQLIYQAILEIHQWLKIDVEDPRTTSIPPFPWMAIRTNEESVGNTVHAGLILISLFFAWSKKHGNKKLLVLYALVPTLGFIVFSALFKWQIYGSRYHLPFFILFSPVIGVMLQRILGDKLLPVAGIALTLSSMPWFLSIDSRPLVPTDRSLIGSILTTPRPEILFANAQYQYEPYHAMASLIQARQCNQVGISIGGIQTEYLIWHVLGAPRSDLHIEWFVAGTASEKYRDLTFVPCAVICERCDWQGSDQYAGLPLVYESAEFKLYLTSPKSP